MTATSVAQIVKEALIEIKNRRLMLTPENYSEVYNEISKKYGYTSAEASRISQYISRLNPEFKNQAQNVNINTIDEFVAFVVSRLNRSNSGSLGVEDSTAYRSLNAFTRRVLQVIAMLHNKDAKSIAEKSMQVLAKKSNSNVLDELREEWFELISSYNDDYLDFLNFYGVKDKNDLRTMMNELEKFLMLQNDQEALSQIATLLCELLEPSITRNLDDSISEFSVKLKANANSINSAEIQDEIRSLLSRRIEEDKNEVAQKVASLNDILGGIGERISELATTSKENTLKAQNIKSDIQDIKFDPSSFEQVKNMLFNIANALEIESRELGAEMNNQEATISKLKERVDSLEKELAEVKQESREDFLTKTANKRALMDEIHRIEEVYKRYGTEYSICFLDIDLFKNINDTYGHDAGDIILSTVATLFKKNIRKMDFIGRYGGEEFIVILPNIGLNDAITFGNKILKVIENFKFIYKNDRIKVTVSAGVATRSLNLSDTATIENADKMLYNSKQNGRNQVSPKPVSK
ncbi:MAG: diguanylate cyclase [Campylobacter sp.]|nr:diguanylate cyclase [Campylobacter sp.]